MRASTPTDDRRTASELREHYEIEKELATRLRVATPLERRTLYAAVYDELFQRVESHPLRVQKERGTVVPTSQIRLLERYFRPDGVFLEIGAGDCALALAVAERMATVYAIEVSAEITASVPPRENLEVFVTDGLSIPVEPCSVTLAYSNQVFEHLHPDDALDHLRQVFTALAPGGRYVCITPNRLTGPHDISKYFDPVATGLHLREYTATELANLMRSVGYERTELWTTRRGISFRIPWTTARAIERVIRLLPHKAGRRVGRSLPIRGVLEGYVVGFKGDAIPSTSSQRAVTDSGE